MPKILLVEDNELNRDMLSRRLTRRGYDVSVAPDGRAAVDKVLAEAPDLVLMDMSLPVLDGWSATREIRSVERTRRTPVIALTAHAMAADRQKALDAGCDDFDTKPVEFSRLLLKIEALLERGRVAAAEDDAMDDLAGLRQELLTSIDAVTRVSETLLEDARGARLEEAAEILAKTHRAGAELRAMAASFLEPAGVLATAAEDREAVSSRIRHELRNPVNALIGYAELLREDGCVEGDLSSLEPDLERLVEAAHQVNGLIGRIAVSPD